MFSGLSELTMAVIVFMAVVAFSAIIILLAIFVLIERAVTRIADQVKNYITEFEIRHARK